MKYVALFLAVFYFIIWLYGGIVYTGLPNASLGGANTRIYYFIGWADPARLPAALLVEDAGRGSEACRRGHSAGHGTAVIDTR